MVLETGGHPALLKDAVATPAGCTVDGILELEEGGLRVTLIKAVVKASQRLGVAIQLTHLKPSNVKEVPCTRIDYPRRSIRREVTPIWWDPVETGSASVASPCRSRNYSAELCPTKSTL